eukprot:552230-Pelagomonas_calceolata.AAC.1
MSGLSPLALPSLIGWAGPLASTNSRAGLHWQGLCFELTSFIALAGVLALTHWQGCTGRASVLNSPASLHWQGSWP